MMRAFNFLLFILLLNFFSCAHRSANDNESEVKIKQKMDINEYSYLETTTGIYNSSKAVQLQLSQKEAILAVKKLNSAKGIAYNESIEEKIEKQSAEYIAKGKWKSAWDTLIKYEPILTHNKNITNQIIYTSLKLEYYDFAIDQLKLALNQNDEMRALNETRLDKEIILAHVYYLSEKYDKATDLYVKLLEKDHYNEAAQYLFLIGYKLKNIETMKTYLTYINEDRPQFIENNILVAQVEMEKGQMKEARNRLELQYKSQPDHQDVVFEYANALIEMEQYKDASHLLDQNEAHISDTRQYHFMKAYIYYQSGDKNKFHEHLSRVNVEDHYKKSLTQLFLNKGHYHNIYSKIFQQAELDQYKFTQLVKESAEKFTYKYINKPQFKDAVLVREEFRSVTEPIRLPASLEFNPSK